MSTAIEGNISLTRHYREPATQLLEEIEEDFYLDIKIWEEFMAKVRVAKIRKQRGSKQQWYLSLD